MVPPAPWLVSHDFAYIHGGAERVTRALTRHVVPDAPLVYLGGDPRLVEEIAGDRGAYPLLPQRVVTASTHRALVAMYPVALARRRPLEGNLLASSYAFAHHVRVTGRTIIYCHSPLRQAWSGRDQYASDGAHLERAAVRGFGSWLRDRDRAAADRADVIVATSRAVRERIHSYYGRTDIPIIAPAIEHQYFHLDNIARPFRHVYLWVGRIVEPYKQLGLVIEALRDDPKRTLIIAGEGRDRERLETSAPENVTFVGWQPSHALARLYQIADAVIFPSEDDFGLVPVEAMACGTPTIAFSRGGALDTIQPDVTGILYDDPTVAGLRSALDRFEGGSWDRAELNAISQRWSVETFATAMRELIGD